MSGKRIYLDTEFTSLNRCTAGLISLALVTNDGQELYVELIDAWTPAVCSDFVLETVLPQLDLDRHGHTTEQARAELLAFLQSQGPGEIISDALAWDWPLLLWLAGPGGIPDGLESGHASIDREIDSTILEEPPHHALEDARLLATLVEKYRDSDSSQHGDLAALIQRLADEESGLFVLAADGTCERVAEALGDAGKTLAVLTEVEDSQIAIEQLVDQLAVPAGHTVSATLEAASRLTGAPIYLLIDHAERLEKSDLTYALKAARDALNSSQLAGLRLVFFSTDRAVLERMTRLNAAAFYCAKLIDMRKL